MAPHQQSFPFLASSSNLFFLLLFSLLCPFCRCSADTLTSAQPMRDGQTLISPNGMFTTGFFSPGESKYRYLGVWYTNDPIGSVVWVANRERPISPNASSTATAPVALVISGSGDLTIVDGSSSLLWSSNISSSGNSSNRNRSNGATVTLMDSGNLVSKDGKGIIVWESFNHPTHVQLPGMKLGWERETGLNRKLTSWRSASDPASGDFTFGFDLRGVPQAFIMKGSVPIFRHGPSNGHMFSNIRSSTFNINFNVVQTENEVSVTWAPYNASILTRFQLDVSGRISRYVWGSPSRRWSLVFWRPDDRCDEYGRCGPNGVCDLTTAPDSECACLRGMEPKSAAGWEVGDRSGGCYKRRPLQCGGGDGFLKLERMKVPDASGAREERSWSLKACEEECLKNCSCTAYASANISDNGSGCLMWYGDLMDVRVLQSGGQDFYVRVATSELDKIVETPSRGFSGVSKVLTVVAVPLVLAFASYGFYFWWRKRKGNQLRKRSEDAFHQNDFKEGGDDMALPFFHSNVISDSTSNFSVENLLGKGGFGFVYKGKLPNGQEIAVKRLSKNSGQGIEEFKNEILLIARLQHNNLVKLLGYCIDGEDKMLIYELMQNKSLDYFIFDQRDKATLDWRKRFNIIKGIARGVLYLHEDSRLRIIHRDLKLSNVLLDAKMNPKISDFGLARIFDRSEVQGKASKVIGTYGYMSPEYVVNGFFSVKSDVFSFGIILLEIISGKRSNGYYNECSSMTLIGYAWKLWVEGRALELVDASVIDSHSVTEISRCIQVGLLCVEESLDNRPSMSSVTLMLQNDTMNVPQPKQPAFCFYRDMPVIHNPSNDHVSITEVEGR